ncbi:twitching motility protein PilI [Natronospira proteinivora]|uniref:Twitching motility protein PilI n=1 Tax=Natronospira proteinivora TaxID=1807133 RepID=A0ABT1GAS7_9GAMM|nr:chemotaxis protein CheW [Natronospira proteinivora]MCP1728409.1 twitching motility protein PilI [Natronospira proteinivora]
MAEITTLADLANQPFQLLQELDRRCRQAAAGRQQDATLEDGDEWVGVGIRIGDVSILVERDEVREVLTVPSMARVPGARSWLRGLANVRGQLLSVVDLQELAGGEPATISRSSRVVAVKHPEIPAGLMVDEVRGFRRFQPDEAVQEVPDVFSEEFRDFFRGGFKRGKDYWAVLSLRDLVESQLFLQAAK